jgi:hypothetical protein
MHIDRCASAAKYHRRVGRWLEVSKTYRSFIILWPQRSDVGHIRAETGSHLI